MNTESRKEKFFFYNTLAILLRAVENEKTTVDLRNEASIHGTIESTDAFMNIVMKNCLFKDPRGDVYSFKMFFVQARNIRMVHIPAHIRIIPAVKQQLKLLPGGVTETKTKKLTYKAKRAQMRQQEGIAAVQKILEQKRKVE